MLAPLGPSTLEPLPVLEELFPVRELFPVLEPFSILELFPVLEPFSMLEAFPALKPFPDRFAAELLFVVDVAGVAVVADGPVLSAACCDMGVATSGGWSCLTAPFTAFLTLGLFAADTGLGVSSSMPEQTDVLSGGESWIRSILKTFLKSQKISV